MESITDFIGGGWKKEIGNNVPEIESDEIGKVMTVEEAEDLYYSKNDCISDDADAEQGRIERWCEQNNIVITD